MTLTQLPPERKFIARLQLASIVIVLVTVALEVVDDLLLRTGAPFVYIGGAVYLAYSLFMLQRSGLITLPRLPANRIDAAEGPRKYRKSKLARVDLERTLSRLDQLMQEEKRYCDEDLSLARLAAELGLTSYQLSELLNKERGLNFAHFVNEYRVREARRLFREEPERSVLSVAFAVGFNSRSRFNEVFKAETGLTPSRFRDQRSA